MSREISADCLLAFIRQASDSPPISAARKKTTFSRLSGLAEGEREASLPRPGDRSGDRVPELNKAHQLAVLVGPNQGGVGIEQAATLLFQGEEAQHARPGDPAAWQVMPIEARGLATVGDGMAGNVSIIPHIIIFLVIYAVFVQIEMVAGQARQVGDFTLRCTDPP